MRALACMVFCAALPGVGFGADAAPAPVFQVADIHGSPRSTYRYMRGTLLRGDRYEIHNATMLDLISHAYSLDGEKVLGGPSWLETDRFEIIAKAPQGTPPETLKLMLQALLADRFKLEIHKDTRPISSYALSVGKGKPKLKESETSAPAGCQGQPQPQTPKPGEVQYLVVSCHNMTMDAFAQELRGMGGNYVTEPVADATGLKGAWDLELKFSPRGRLAHSGSDGITLFDALDKQLGLHLEPGKYPSPVIVVDKVNQKPTPNSLEITRSLPPSPPAEFEVANIKPSNPDIPQRARLQNGRVDAQSFPLKQMIMLAWDINSDELLAGAPKWLDSAKFDIVAKVSSAGGINVQQVDDDSLRIMVQALLIDRFKIKTHMEDRLVSAYTLTAAKPKMKMADPLSRAGYKEGPGPDGKDPRLSNPLLNRLVSVQNMTMAQFAEELPSMASGYLKTPVLDKTGLDGGWDFTLSFSGIGLLRPQTPGPGGDAAGASDPTGGVSLFDAVGKLGLKLELQKRPLPVLVIDHIEEKPTEN